MWPFYLFASVLLTDLHHLHHGIDVAGAALLQGKSDDLRQDCRRDVLPGWDAAPWDASWNLRQKLIQEIKRNLTVKLVPKTKCMSVVNVRSYLLIDSNYLWPTSLFAATQTQTTQKKYEHRSCNQFYLHWRRWWKQTDRRAQPQLSDPWWQREWREGVGSSFFKQRTFFHPPTNPCYWTTARYFHFDAESQSYLLLRECAWESCCSLQAVTGLTSTFQ